MKKKLEKQKCLGVERTMLGRKVMKGPVSYRTNNYSNYSLQC